MTNTILFVESSPRAEQSVSSKLARNLVDRLLDQQPGSTVVSRHLATDDPLPHVSGLFIPAMYTPPDYRTAAMNAELKVSDSLVDELITADIIVIASPMYNFNVPSSLKAWVDHVVRLGRTFVLEDGGYRGLLRDKVGTPAESVDFQVPYLKHVLRFMGVEHVHAIRAEGAAIAPEDAFVRGIRQIESLFEPAY